MTVRELIEQLQDFPKDAEVLVLNGWDPMDEDGILTDTSYLEGVTSQTLVEDRGDIITQVLLAKY